MCVIYVGVLSGYYDDDRGKMYSPLTQCVLKKKKNYTVYRLTTKYQFGLKSRIVRFWSYICEIELTTGVYSTTYILRHGHGSLTCISPL